VDAFLLPPAPIRSLDEYLATVIRTVGGGTRRGRAVKAVFSGVANPVLSSSQLGVALTYEDMRAAGSGLGAAGFIVHDDTACMVEVARQISRFLFVESCGQCPPCKLGGEQITERLTRIQNGVGTDEDVTEIGGWLDRVTDGNRCYLPVEEQQVVGSILSTFPEEVVAHVEEGHCPRPRPLPFSDLEVAFTLFGWLGAPPPELLEWRRFGVAGVEDDGRLDWCRLGEQS
jgi:NADH:ubiquinone oxidoreductase subunit F (NADH-binding)